MAIACCHKKYAEECDILVCVDAHAPNHPNLYQYLRFDLLASSWLPRPLGILLWSALHVTFLIVGGPAVWVLQLLTAFLFYSVCYFGGCFFYFGSCYVVFGVIAVAIDLILLLGRSIRSSVGFLACHERIVQWSGSACFTVLLWKEFKCFTRDIFWEIVPIGVPCMSGSLYKETRDRNLETWARWSEEVVHMHDAIAL